MADAAVNGGMSTRDQAYYFAAQTFKGAAHMLLLDIGKHPAILIKDMACSPTKSTTIEAEDKGFTSAVITAVQ